MTTPLDDLIAWRTDLVADQTSKVADLDAIIATLPPDPIPDPPPPTINAAKDLLGFFPGYANLPAFSALEKYVGRQVKFVAQFADGNPANFGGSVWGEVTNPGQFQTLADRITLVEAIPLAFCGFQDTTTPAGRVKITVGLLATSQGSNDTVYRTAFNYLKSGGHGDAIIRLGWEFDGGWMPWSSIGNESLWTGAFRHVVQLARSISPDFKFDWNGDPGKTELPPTAYPGDDVVDIIGLDVYDKGPSVDPAWLKPYLAQQVQFAVAHGKQVSYPEWALTGNVSNSGGDDPAFIDMMADHMESLPATGPGSLAYHSYFNADENDGWHALSHFPNASARFLARFGGPDANA